VYLPTDGLHGLAEVGPCDILSFLFFSPFLILYYWIYFYIFLFLHITKASPHLTLYRLKGKKGVGRLRTPYRLKNYDAHSISMSTSERLSQLDLEIHKVDYKEP
jgi:hypothetical protein